MSRLALAAILCALAAAMLAGRSAHAAAFQLREGDPDWLANAFAGDAAKAYDAGTAWNNPAGMTRLDHSEIDNAINYFDPGIKFTGNNVVGGRSTPGVAGGDAGPQEFSAGFEGVYSATPDLKFGAATEAPYGLRTAYPANFVGRYQALVSSIFDIQLGLSAAYRLSPQLSIGGGPVLTYFHARLTQAINTQAFVPGGGDAIVDIHGDDIAAGYHLGALYEVTPSLRVGIDYHSRIGVDVTGQQRAAIPPAITARSALVGAVLKALDQPAETQIAIPDNATVSLYDELNSEWSVMGSVQWTNWSLIKTLTVQAGNSLEATPINFRDTWMGSIGANYRPPVFPRLTLQFGLLYDTGANTDATRGARLPDEDRIGVGTGVSFAVTPRMNVRLAYLHEFPGFGGDKINYSNNFPNAGTIVGAYADNADVASAGVTLKF